MRYQRNVLLLAAVSSLMGLSARSAVPTEMHFQGFLVSADGVPLDGPQNLVLTLYDAATGGDWVWTETQVANLERGAFRVVLGGVAPLEASLFEDWPLWLGITVNGTVLNPRTLLGAVPYAAVCENATGDIQPRSVSVGGALVIDAQGKWVGSPTSLVGPQGPAGPQGPQGEQGPQGPRGAEAGDCNPNHYLDGDGTCKRSTFSCNAGEVLDGSGNCYIPTPVGTIIMWSGSAETIPTGWRLCDGSNGTPDLRGRFVVAAGGDYAAGQTGGSNGVTLTVEQMPAHNHTAATAGVHTHSMTAAGGHTHTMDSAGSHSHTVGQVSIYRMSGDSADGPNKFDTGSGSILQTLTIPSSPNTGSAGAHTHAIQSGGSHTHPLADSGGHTHTISTTGGSQPFDNRPAYYALAYIMRVSY